MIKKVKLSKGAQVIIENIPYVRSAAIGLWLKTGSINEEPDTAGMSHFIEHMMFKGTENRSAKEIAASIDNIGGQMNAFTGKESTCYYVKVLDTHIEEGVDVLLDMLFNSKFDPEEMEKEKTVIYEEINMYEDSPDDTAHDLLSQTIFNGHPLGKPVIGNQKAIEGFTRESVKKYLGDNYTMDSIVVSVAGNVNEEKLIDILEKKFKTLNLKKDHTPTPLPEYIPNFVMKVKDIEQSHICLGTKGYHMDHDNYYGLSIVNNIMGGSMSSRLFQKIREENGLAYSVYSYTNSYTKDGIFGIYAGVNPTQVEEATTLIIKELIHLRENGISEEELAMAKEQIKGNYIMGLESVSGRMTSIGRNELLLGKVFTPDDILTSIDKVQMDEINEIIEKITQIENYSGSLVSRVELDMKKIVMNAMA